MDAQTLWLTEWVKLETRDKASHDTKLIANVLAV
jgi:hypothetical protein